MAIEGADGANGLRLSTACSGLLLCLVNSHNSSIHKAAFQPSQDARGAAERRLLEGRAAPPASDLLDVGRKMEVSCEGYQGSGRCPQVGGGRFPSGRSLQRGSGGFGRRLQDPHASLIAAVSLGRFSLCTSVCVTSHRRRFLAISNLHPLNSSSLAAISAAGAAATRAAGPF